MSAAVFSEWKFFPLKNPAGNLLGNGSVLLAGTAICKFKILKNKDGNIFLAWPSESYEKDGEKKYSNYIFLPDEATRELFQKEGVAAWETAEANPVVSKPVTSTTKKTNIPF